MKSRCAEQAEEIGVPVTPAEEEQARNALTELARRESDPDMLCVPREQFELALPLFELGWAMGVRMGNTGPAVTGVPVDWPTVESAFAAPWSGSGNRLALQLSRILGPLFEGAPGPVVWQKVEYHGSVREQHGVHWVHTIRAFGGPHGGTPRLGYDLCEIRGGTPMLTVTGVRRESLTPLPIFRAW
ncbi:hypothetical protein [Streptomyces spectabilis]|uniref:Uncharacterized protein n=1 Tax=Streptomyces spectabilis TaxID=68270 RepID=A0A7W8B2S2_STRST|nr:hypothetical protein [Streptomyces spectabilis]MBB5109299.1 hypothetical protein [Streptomyces spectabilis]GGV52305.1 hypothetical protein GCM10010245_82270 [Streptomyces spectabilis]